MPTTAKYDDIEKTFEVKNLEVTLSCGKCPTGQLIASEKKGDDNYIIHVCDQCQREQPIEGVSYPHTLTKRVEVGRRNLERTEVIPDKDPEEYNQADIRKLSVPELIIQLRTTRNPEQVDFIEVCTDFQLRQQVELCRTLYDMARQAAVLRAETKPASDGKSPLTSTNIDSLDADGIIQVLRTTRYSSDVDLIQVNQVIKMLLFSPEFRKALYDIAKEVVTSRTKPAVVSQAEPVKNKGGRPRKYPLVKA